MFFGGIFNYYPFHGARNKTAQVSEHKLVVKFYHVDAATQRIILVRNAVVDGFADYVRLSYWRVSSGKSVPSRK